MVLNNEIFYEKRDTSNSQGGVLTVDPSNTDQKLLEPFADPNTASGMIDKKLYIRSEYSSAYGIDIEKKYKNITASTLHAGDRIEINITLKNTTASTIKNIEYLDTLPQIFRIIPESKYRATLGTQSKENLLDYTQADDYSLTFQ